MFFLVGVLFSVYCLGQGFSYLFIYWSLADRAADHWLIIIVLKVIVNAMDEGCPWAADLTEESVLFLPFSAFLTYFLGCRESTNFREVLSSSTTFMKCTRTKKRRNEEGV